MEPRRNIVPLLGRTLLGLPFFFSGLNKIFAWGQTAGYMAARGFPLVPLFLLAAVILEIGGSLSLFLGLRVKLGAAALLIFLIAATLIFHNFWAFMGAEKQEQMINFMKNVAIMGGLLFVLTFGPGPMSFDGKRNRKSQNLD